jgi:hypothetical protein
MGRYITIKEERAMASLYLAGWSEAQIGRFYDRPRTSIQTALKRQQVPKRKRGSARGSQGSPLRTSSRPLRCITTACLIRMIADTLGIDVRAVSYRLNRAGVRRRSISEANRLRWRTTDRQ